MGVNYLEIIDRMRWAGKLKNDSAVARAVGVTPQALSNYKKRGEMPTDLVLKFAGIYSLSVDWLISGEGEMYKTVIRAEPRQPTAAEDTVPYMREPARVPSLSSLTPDEIIYVGKLLKILRGPNKSMATAAKHTIDGLLRAIEAAAMTPPPDTEIKSQAT
ncbi:MAG: helix-turn-helix domain-containing protein [Deltaproteobacteria bacterium]|nr:helix-turn-helix domain-containing protein [Deltaproteobacteria bacterium]